MQPEERLAVIDLGSNSFRLVVFMAADGWWKRTDEIYEPVRIAAGLRNGSVDAVATSAIRDAENADGFLERARKRFGLPIRVLSREEEARYGYLAAVNSTTLTDGCVLDLGGGSMQLVRVRDRLAVRTGSWRLGTVLMSERYLPPNGPAKRKQLEELCDHIAGELESAPWLGSVRREKGG